MADEQTPDVTSEADLSIEDFVARGNARDRGEEPPARSDAAAASSAPDASAAPAAPASDKDKTSAAAGDKRSRDARKQSIQTEIDELTTTKHTTRKEVEAAQAELTRLRAELQTLQQQRPAERPAPQPAAAAPSRPAPVPADDPEPQLEQFAQEADPYGAWSRAVARWETRQEHRRLLSAHHARTMYDQRTAKLKDKLAAYETSHPGFQKSLHPSVIDVKFTTPTEFGTVLGDLIVDSEHTAALLDHFSRNYADFQRIAALHPVLVARELGKIESRFDSNGHATKPPAISQAKPVNKPIGGSPVVSDDDDDESSLPIEEFVRRGNARDAARTRGAHPR